MRSADLDYVLGLGSNLGNRLEFLRYALGELRSQSDVRHVSSLYETVAVGPAQPDYLNAAVRLHAPLTPSALLDWALAIERSCGRERRERWGPRTLDLDLLFITGVTVTEPGLVVPHRELHRRAFALLPLLDVAPEACDPTSGEPYAQIAQRLDRTGVRRLPGRVLGWSSGGPADGARSDRPL